jgi:pimeloyl-ACP methyl ester carboxylesterase
MGRRTLITVVAVAALLAAVYLLGPRVAADTTVHFDPAAIGSDPDAYLEKREAAVAGIREGLHKEIVWADPSNRAKTPIAVVYVHGFSASKGEVRPLPDLVAKGLGANLFYTRLTGHGQDPAAMSQGSINAWVNDFAEAVAIGQAIGDKVLVVATSTGASLAVQAVASGKPSGVSAVAMISPNFGVKAGGAALLTMPWGAEIARLLIGKERSFAPRNALQAKLWTYRYPVEILPPMAALTELALRAPVETAAVPALFIFSDSDTVVRAELTREVAGRWGAPHEMVLVNETDDPDHHVIAGDAMSPSTTGYLAERIVVWARAILN